MNAALVGVVIGGVIAAVTQILAAVVQDRLVRKRAGIDVRRETYAALIDATHSLIVAAAQHARRRRGWRRSSPVSNVFAERISAQYARVLLVSPEAVQRTADSLHDATSWLAHELTERHLDATATALAAFIVAAREDAGIPD